MLLLQRWTMAVAPDVRRVLVIRVGPFHRFHNVCAELQRVIPAAELEMVTTGGMLPDLQRLFPRIARFHVHRRGRSLQRLLARLLPGEYDFVVVTGPAFFVNLLCYRTLPGGYYLLGDDQRWLQVRAVDWPTWWRERGGTAGWRALRQTASTMFMHPVRNAVISAAGVVAGCILYLRLLLLRQREPRA